MQPNRNRRLIPKWRSSKITATLPEALPVGAKHARSPNFDVDTVSQLIKQLISEWRNDSSIGGAANILSFGHIAHLHPLLAEPAAYIVESADAVPRQLYSLAQAVLGNTGENIPPPAADIESMQAVQYGEAFSLKKRIATNPRDAIALVDLARVYSSLGQAKKARTAIVTAVNVYPEHRFIIRAASRFFVHNDEAEQALYILNRAQRTKYDPWLMATQIAVSTILGKPQTLVGKVKEIIKSRSLAPVHMSELCGSLATVHLDNGNNREARRVINLALTSPNDNTIAQAIWLAQHYDFSINTRQEWFLDPLSSEARYYNADLLGDFDSAKRSALEWQADEPFSSHPAIAAVYAASICEEYEEAEALARNALRLHNNNSQLKGNLVFALAAQNRLPEALVILQDVIALEKQQVGHVTPHSLANLGMLLYRSGDKEEGERLYRDAVNVYEKNGDLTRKAIAIAFLAREATLAEASNAEELRKEAVEVVRKTSSKAAERILSTMFLFGDTAGENRSRSLVRLPKWRYDKDRNIIFISRGSPFRER